jgi:GNAT superfamily N-acetyltransferase
MDEAPFDPAVELAENPNTYNPCGPGDDRVVTDRWVLWLSARGDAPGWNVAQRFRFEADELDEVRAEIHDAARARGRTVCTWEVSSHATPTDLVERLYERGLVDDDDPQVIALALTEPPTDDAPSPDVVVERVTTPEGEQLAADIAAVAFGSAPNARAVDPEQRTITYLAYLDGEPVGRATGSFSRYGCSMFGGATLPHARGRGVFRALCRARWQDAVERGTSLAVTQGGRQSLPILLRLGFREVGWIRILVDPFDR